MSCFSKLFSNSAEYKNIKLNIKMGHYPVGVLGLPPAPRNMFIHTVCAENNKTAIVIAPDDASAEKICSDLLSLGTAAAVYPARDFVFSETQSSSGDYEKRRIGTLTRFSEKEIDVLVCSAEAALQSTIPKETLKQSIISIEQGMTLTPEALKAELIKSGYSFSEMVEGAGQFSFRGGILDVFPSNSENPIRIEFWGDEIDSISEFDVLSQRRQSSVSCIKIPPCYEILFGSNEIFSQKLTELAKSVKGKHGEKIKTMLNGDAEMLNTGIRPGCCDKYYPLAYQKCATVFDYLQNGFLFVCDSFSVREKAVAAEKLLNEELRELFLDGTLCKGLDRFGVTAAYLIESYTQLSTFFVDNFARGSFDTPVKDLINYSINSTSQWDGSYSVLIEDISPYIHKKYTTVIFAGSVKAAESLFEQFNDDDVPAVLSKELPPFFQTGYVNIIPGSLSAGLEYAGAKLTVISYGRYAKSSRRSVSRLKKSENSFNSLDELHRGDYVVHATNGIGIFDGIEKVQMEGLTKDYIKIKYAKGDILYVPVTKLELVSKYIGPHEEDGGRTVKINRLGSGDWEKTKQKVRGAVKDIAANLIKIYAERQCSSGFAFSPDIDMQNDFERRFEFDETEDQLRCIDEIKKDMEKNCPMDRLLCGDVGFGKTEVALRAAFKCICDGKQVAFLVPTTILALQHYHTFLHRFDGFPVEAEMLCRFRSPKQQKEILKRVKSGSLDIISGTHRLISKDVEFKNLGLLIVDEEQRFGVEQKEKLKAKFPGVDVLTLSATPIPRTLNFAMMGIRDLSVITEAPLDRFPVQTYVVEHDMGILSQAIAKELRRGGQVYYLHNRVENIEATASELKNFFPDAEIDCAHGKMNEEELSNVWKKLIEGETDILVCTTIIETGVDVPNVNTLIIEDADKMGLSQLHQLRGRVGRSSRRASCFCTFKRGRELSEVAEKRLSTIREFTQFGAGFKIAMRDLEIRGAGDMLGAKQHGHMEAVGYDMYISLLSDAIAELKSGEKAYVPKRDCLVDIQIDAHIPDEYIESYPQRIAIYKRIADIHSSDDSMDVTDELIDRYGEPPASVMGLIKVALLKNTAADNGIYEITQRATSLLLYVNEIDKSVLTKLSLIKGRVMANASAKPYYAVRLKNNQTPIEALEEIAAALSVVNSENVSVKQ